MNVVNRRHLGFRIGCRLILCYSYLITFLWNSSLMQRSDWSVNGWQQQLAVWRTVADQWPVRIQPLISDKCYVVTVQQICVEGAGELVTLAAPELTANLRRFCWVASWCVHSLFSKSEYWAKVHYNVIVMCSSVILSTVVFGEKLEYSWLSEGDNNT